MTKHVVEQINDALFTLPPKVTKRNGAVVEFDITRIERAIEGCWGDFEEPPATPIFRVVQAAGFIISSRFHGAVASVEDIQDCVEAALVSVGEFDAARNYMAYRDQRAKERNLVPADVKALFDESEVYFPTALQQFQFFDKYSRFNWDLGRRETWMETVSRVVEYLRWLVGDIGKELPEETWVLIEDSILAQEAMPSMRALAMAGEAAKRNSLSIYNCGGYDTKYLTIEGIKTLGETAGTTQTVLNGAGQWVKGEIREFGVQPLQEITFRPGAGSNTKIRHRVQFTPDHRWITTNRGEVTGLRVGDRVRFISAPEAEINNDAWIAGFGYGDGTITSQGEAQVRLCGAKAAHLSRFTDYGHCGVYTPPSNNGDPTVIFHKGHFSDWKILPLTEDAEYLASWLEGYLAADGHHATDGVIHLGSQDNNAIEFVIEIAPFAGYMVSGRSTATCMETNFGRRKAPLQNLMLRRDGEFKVTAIEDLQVEETVFCAVVPDGHDFVLANGIHTGNCSYSTVDCLETFVEAMMISMAGCGVGYSVERQYVEQFPRIQRQKPGEPKYHLIEDSSSGWAESLRIGLTAWFAGEDVVFEYGLIRQAGSPLKVKGGRASGPEPLRYVLDFCRSKILSRQGSFLRTLDAHDMMCVIGGAAVSGGVRRTAMISLYSWDDHDMRDCKAGVIPDYRWNANNSAVWPDGLSQIEVTDQMMAMIREGRGEPGIFSRSNAINTLPERRQVADLGTNPCLTGDSVIATVDGPRTFADLAETEADVLVYAWHPETKLPVIRWMRRPHKTRSNTEVVAVTFDSGLVVRCTPDHNFYSFRGQKVMAKNLKPGQSIRAFSASRDSSGHERIHGWDNQRNAAAHQWTHRMLWEANYGEIPEGMVIAHLDGNGTNNDLDNLALMTDLAHRQYDMPMRQAAGFDGHSPNHKVVSVEPAGFEDVYNGCVDDAHTYIVLDQDPVAGHMSGIVSANCGEINLRPQGLCNLTIAVARPNDTVESLMEKVEIATIIGTIQSLAVSFPGMRQEWVDNCIEERLLGVDITGQADCPLLDTVTEFGATLRDELREHAIAVNKTFAEMLDINPSAAITCDKPSGNSSQLLNTSSGLHRRWAPFYIRRTRVSAATPVYKVLKDAGVNMLPENGSSVLNASTYVVSWPVKAPEGALTRKDFSAVDQCEFWLLNKMHWTEHNPSVTITYQENEILALIQWVWDHKDLIGGMAFLPADDAQYQQAPYEEITETRYNEMMAEFPHIDFSLLFAHEATDMTTSSGEVACSAGGCDLL